MAIELSIPLSHSSYRRTFAAEIDVLAENELLVRGSMRDHRFAFEHVWRLADFLMWDNRCTIHARTDFPKEERRLLRRCTVEGEPLYE